MKLKLLIFTLLITAISFAQSKSTITGVVTDKDFNNETLPFANVLIKGTKINTTTDVDGKYTLNVDAGNYVVQFSFVGYNPIEVPVKLTSGQSVTLNQALSAGAYTLQDVVVTATVNRQKETALLLEQKEAVSFKAAIGAEEIARKGANDVATAVTKVSGITKQEGSGSIFVRGLGDRYNVTTLNGLPLPSNNPSNKNIALDIFSTGIVDNIGISKTFEAQNYADFGGANINISSKKFTGSPYVTVAARMGANSNVLKLDHFYLQDGPSYTGFKSGEIPSDPTKPYNYGTSWDRQESKFNLNNKLSLAGGRKFNFEGEGSISTFITASFSANNRYTEGYSRGSFDATGFSDADFYRKAFKHNTNTTVMGSADYKINSNNSILFTSLFLNSTEQDYSEYEGTNENFDGGGDAQQQIQGFIKRGTFQKTQFLVNQLTGKDKFNDQWNLNWALGYSTINNSTPDRMQNTFVLAPDATNYTFFTNSNIHNHRFFQDLNENEISANVALSYNFGEKNENDDYKKTLTFGYSGKSKQVDYNMLQYSFFPDRNVISFSKEDINNTDNWLNAANFGSSSSAKIDQLYNGNLDINAGFVNFKYLPTEKWSIIAGARLEQTTQNVFYLSVYNKPNGDVSNSSKINFLPSLISKYELNDKQNLKFAASKTYTLPQFKEKVGILYEDVAQAYLGNRYLYASTNYNADLGWEFFPKSDELFSATVFGKIIQNPINEVFLNSSSRDITYVNSGNQATVAGVELEYRKNIFETENEENLKTKLSFDINGSYLYHNQDLDEDKVFRENNKLGVDFTYTESKLSGASNFLTNANITFLKEFTEKKDLTATLSYAHFSDKLAVIGSSNIGNVVDKAIDKLDFIVNSNLNKRIKLTLMYNNILNPTFRRVLEQSKVPNRNANDLLVNSYKLGSDISLTLNYTF